MCSVNAPEGQKDESQSRIIPVGQSQLQDEGEVSLPLPVGDPRDSAFPQHGCTPPGFAGCLS